MRTRKSGIQDRLNLIFEKNDPNPVLNALLTIGEAISRQGAVIRQAADEQEQIGHLIVMDDAYQDQYLDGIIEEKVYIIEDLLAIAHVICQTDIAYIVTRTKKLIEYVDKEHSYKISLLAGKDDLMKLDPFILASGSGAIQVINAYANYFKHKDEWTDNWNNILTSKDARTRTTVSVLVSAGASEHSSNNFRSIAKQLGNHDFDKTSRYANILNTWREAIRNMIEVELRSAGLIT